MGAAALALLLLFSGAVSAANPRVVRSASSVGEGSSGASRQQSQIGPAKNKQQAGPKKIGKVQPSKPKGDDAEDSAPDMPPVEKCLRERAVALGDGECSFLLPPEIGSSAGQSLLCLYNYRESGKYSSVYGYYLSQYWGVSESQIRDAETMIDVRDNSRAGMYKYYEYIIREAQAGTLKESKILDNLANRALENSTIPYKNQTAIMKKSVSAVPMNVGVVRADLEKCTAAARAVLGECDADGDFETKTKILEECRNYESALAKVAGAKKAEAMGFDSAVVRALSARLDAEMQLAQAEAQRESDRQKLQEQQEKNTLGAMVGDIKAERGKLVVEVNRMIAGADKSSGTVREAKEAAIADKKHRICLLDGRIGDLDRDYVPGDNLGVCKVETPVASSDKPKWGEATKIAEAKSDVVFPIGTYKLEVFGGSGGGGSAGPGGAGGVYVAKIIVSEVQGYSVVVGAGGAVGAAGGDTTFKYGPMEAGESGNALKSGATEIKVPGGGAGGSVAGTAGAVDNTLSADGEETPAAVAGGAAGAAGAAGYVNIYKLDESYQIP